MRIRMTDEREDRLRRLMQATGEATKSGAIDVACKHYLADLENKQRHTDVLTPEIAEAYHTPFIPLEVEIEKSVGRTDD